MIVVELRCEKTMHGLLEVAEQARSQGRVIERLCQWHSRNGAKVYHAWDADTGERLRDRKDSIAA